MLDEPDLIDMACHGSKLEKIGQNSYTCAGVAGGGEQFQLRNVEGVFLKKKDYEVKFQNKDDNWDGLRNFCLFKQTLLYVKQGIFKNTKISKNIYKNLSHYSEQFC